jgi:hypothetical protein
MTCPDLNVPRTPCTSCPSGDTVRSTPKGIVTPQLTSILNANEEVLRCLADQCGTGGGDITTLDFTMLTNQQITDIVNAFDFTQLTPAQQAALCALVATCAVGVSLQVNGTTGNLELVGGDGSVLSSVLLADSNQLCDADADTKVVLVESGNTSGGANNGGDQINFQVDGNVVASLNGDKFTLNGLFIDPATGLELTPQAAVPTLATDLNHTLWLNSADADKTYRGSVNLEDRGGVDLNVNANMLELLDESGTVLDTVDLSLYIDDTNLARLVSGTVDNMTGIATFTRDDSTTFDLDMSAFLSDLAFTGADATNAGTQGDVPAPQAGDQNKYIAGDGTWKDIPAGFRTSFGASNTQYDLLSFPPTQPVNPHANPNTNDTYIERYSNGYAYFSYNGTDWTLNLFQSSDDQSFSCSDQRGNEYVEGSLAGPQNPPVNPSQADVHMEAYDNALVFFNYQSSGPGAGWDGNNICFVPLSAISENTPSCITLPQAALQTTVATEANTGIEVATLSDGNIISAGFFNVSLDPSNTGDGGDVINPDEGDVVNVYLVGFPATAVTGATTNPGTMYGFHFEVTRTAGNLVATQISAVSDTGYFDDEASSVAFNELLTVSAITANFVGITTGDGFSQVQVLGEKANLQLDGTYVRDDSSVLTVADAIAGGWVACPRDDATGHIYDGTEKTFPIGSPQIIHELNRAVMTHDNFREMEFRGKMVPGDVTGKSLHAMELDETGDGSADIIGLSGVDVSLGAGPTSTKVTAFNRVLDNDGFENNLNITDRGMSWASNIAGYQFTIDQDPGQPGEVVGILPSGRPGFLNIPTCEELTETLLPTTFTLSPTGVAVGNGQLVFGGGGEVGGTAERVYPVQNIGLKHTLSFDHFFNGNAGQDTFFSFEIVQSGQVISTGDFEANSTTAVTETVDFYPTEDVTIRFTDENQAGGGPSSDIRITAVSVEATCVPFVGETQSNNGVTGEHVDGNDVLTWIKEECYVEAGSPVPAIAASTYDNSAQTGVGQIAHQAWINSEFRVDLDTYTAPLEADQANNDWYLDQVVLERAGSPFNASNNFNLQIADAQGNIKGTSTGGVLTNAGPTIFTFAASDEIKPEPTDVWTFVGTANQQGVLSWGNDVDGLWTFSTDDSTLNAPGNGFPADFVPANSSLPMTFTFEQVPLTPQVVRTYDDGSLFTVDKNGNTVTSLASIPATWELVSCQDLATKVVCFEEQVDGALLGQTGPTPSTNQVYTDLLGSQTNTPVDLATWTSDRTGFADELVVVIEQFSTTNSGGGAVMTITNQTTGDVATAGFNWGSQGVLFGDPATPVILAINGGVNPLAINEGDQIVFSLEVNNGNPWGISSISGNNNPNQKALWVDRCLVGIPGIGLLGTLSQPAGEYLKYVDARGNITYYDEQRNIVDVSTFTEVECDVDKESKIELSRACYLNDIQKEDYSNFSRNGDFNADQLVSGPEMSHVMNVSGNRIRLTVQTRDRVTDLTIDLTLTNANTGDSNTQTLVIPAGAVNFDMFTFPDFILDVTAGDVIEADFAMSALPVGELGIYTHRNSVVGSEWTQLNGFTSRGGSTIDKNLTSELQVFFEDKRTVATYDDGSLMDLNSEYNQVDPIDSIPATWTEISCLSEADEAKITEIVAKQVNDFVETRQNTSVFSVPGEMTLERAYTVIYTLDDATTGNTVLTADADKTAQAIVIAAYLDGLGTVTGTVSAVGEEVHITGNSNLASLSFEVAPLTLGFNSGNNPVEVLAGKTWSQTANGQTVTVDFGEFDALSGPTSGNGLVMRNQLAASPASTIAVTGGPAPTGIRLRFNDLDSGAGAEEHLVFQDTPISIASVNGNAVLNGNTVEATVGNTDVDVFVEELISTFDVAADMGGSRGVGVREVELNWSYVSTETEITGPITKLIRCGLNEFTDLNGNSVPAPDCFVYDGTIEYLETKFNDPTSSNSEISELLTVTSQNVIADLANPPEDPNSVLVFVNGQTFDTLAGSGFAVDNVGEFALTPADIGFNVETTDRVVAYYRPA